MPSPRAPLPLRYALACLLLGTLCSAEARPAAAGLSSASNAVRFAPHRNSGPFVFEEQGKVSGLSIELLDAIGARTGLKLIYQEPRPVAEILQAAQRGEVDLISSLRATPERAQYLSFTQPYVTVPVVFATRRSVLPAEGGRFLPLTLADMRGKPVAVGQRYAVESFVRQRFPDVQWVGVSDDEAGLRALRDGRVAAVVADIASLRFFAERMQYRDLLVHGQVGFDYALSFAYRKELTELGRLLDEGLRAIPARERRAILQRWIDPSAFGLQDRKHALVRWIALVLLLCAAALLLFAWWRRGRPSAF